MRRRARPHFLPSLLGRPCRRPSTSVRSQSSLSPERQPRHRPPRSPARSGQPRWLCRISVRRASPHHGRPQPPPARVIRRMTPNPVGSLIACSVPRVYAIVCTYRSGFALPTRWHPTQHIEIEKERSEDSFEQSHQGRKPFDVSPSLCSCLDSSFALSSATRSLMYDSTSRKPGTLRSSTFVLSLRVMTISPHKPRPRPMAVTSETCT